MSINPGTFASMIAANVITQETTDVVTNAIDNPNQDKHTVEHTLYDIHALLVELYAHYKNNTFAEPDIFNIVTITKGGLGVPFQPKHTGTRQHFAIFSPTQVLLNVSCVIGNFNITIPAAQWTFIDFPENTTYVLDNTVTSNNLLFWFRETNSTS